MSRAPSPSAGLSGWVVAALCAVSFLLAWLDASGAHADPTASAAGSTSAAGSVSVASRTAASASGADASASGGVGSAYRSGTASLPDGAPVPLAYLPPGSSASPVPSDEVFPPQSITIRFNHKKHVKELKQPCTTCHLSAYTSGSSKDRLMPAPTVCSQCHDVNHADNAAVKPGKGADGQCSYCHLGDHAGEGGKVAPMVIPTPALVFPHDKHLARNIPCVSCHGKVSELELATREQLPRMAGCFVCHNLTGPAQGDAKGSCETCHLTNTNGTLQTTFASGRLLPPAWLHLSNHSPDWLDRHKVVASNDSAYCGSCHTETDCADCHDGRVRNRKVHPGDFLSMHAQSARQDSPRCVSCHQLQTFCGDCHRRVGVARDSPSGNQPTGKRFHPSADQWVTGPRGMMHHASEAQRNLNACVSCHSERDCATCHASRIAGGGGKSPHPAGFDNGCAGAFDRNPRPCLVCHDAAVRQKCK
jgi:hypothetical protein